MKLQLVCFYKIIKLRHSNKIKEFCGNITWFCNLIKWLHFRCFTRLHPVIISSTSIIAYIWLNSHENPRPFFLRQLIVYLCITLLVMVCLWMEICLKWPTHFKISSCSSAAPPASCDKRWRYCNNGGPEHCDWLFRVVFTNV